MTQPFYGRPTSLPVNREDRNRATSEAAYPLITGRLW